MTGNQMRESVERSHLGEQLRDERIGVVRADDGTSSKDVATDPYYETTGTEEFRGCLDRRRDGKCGAKDPSGTLSWGACWHPVTGGTGDFTGAQGVLTFVDSQVGDSVRTKYLGTITTSGDNTARRTATATAAMRTGC
jgi:hypothetical protein